MSDKNDFKACLLGFEYINTLDGGGFPVAVVLDNGLDVSEPSYEQRVYIARAERATEQVVDDNLRLIERNRDLERELAKEKAKIGNVSRIADSLHADAVELSGLFGDVVPENAARECALKRSVAERIKGAIG